MTILLVVVAAAADVLVDAENWQFGLRCERCALETFLQERFDVFPARHGRAGDAERMGAGRVEPCSGVALSGAYEAEDSAISKLGSWVLGERHLRDARDVRTDRAGPTDEAFGWPLAVVAMRDR